MHTSHYITILQYIGETGRRLGDRFREHLRDVELNDEDASKHVVRHFNLPNHSKQHMAVWGLSLHLGSSESRKTLEQKFILRPALLNPTVSTGAFHSTNLLFLWNRLLFIVVVGWYYKFVLLSHDKVTWCKTQHFNCLQCYFLLLSWDKHY